MPKYRVTAEMYRGGELLKIGDVIDVESWGKREIPVRGDDGNPTGEVKTVELKPSRAVVELKDDGTEVRGGGKKNEPAKMSKVDLDAPVTDEQKAAAKKAADEKNKAADKHGGPFGGAKHSGKE